MCHGPRSLIRKPGMSAGLFHQHHPFRNHLIANSQHIDVQSAGGFLTRQVCTIPGDVVASGTYFAVNQRLDFLTLDVVDLERNSFIHSQVEADRGRGVERIGIVLFEIEISGNHLTAVGLDTGELVFKTQNQAVIGKDIAKIHTAEQTRRDIIA